MHCRLMYGVSETLTDGHYPLKTRRILISAIKLGVHYNGRGVLRGYRQLDLSRELNDKVAFRAQKTRLVAAVTWYSSICNHFTSSFCKVWLQSFNIYNIHILLSYSFYFYIIISVLYSISIWNLSSFSLSISFTESKNSVWVSKFQLLEYHWLQMTNCS